MSGRDRAVQPDATRRYSPAQASFFRAYFARFFRKHMNALRLADPERARRLAEVDGPIVVYTNHPGWWDGALYVLLPKLCFPTRRAYAPVEAGMMTKYGFFERIGGFGVDLGTARGAAAFLRQSDRILARSDSLLWISVQGQFADVRQRPLGIKAGIAHVCERAPRATVIPAAFDYVFWTERGSEALVRFGEPMRAGELLAMEREERLAHLEDRLTDTMDRLAADAMSRDPTRFETLLSGEVGVGGIYAVWRRLAARLRGERWDPGHASRR